MNNPIPPPPPPLPQHHVQQPLVAIEPEKKVKEYAPNGKNNKAVLGVPEDHTVVWIPYDVNDHDNTMLERCAAASGVKKTVYLRDLLRGLIEATREELKDQASRFTGVVPRRGRQASETTSSASKQKLQDLIARQEKAKKIAAEILAKAGLNV